MTLRRSLYCTLLLFAVTRIVDSARCNRMIDGTTRPRSSAEEKYRFFMTLYNRTDIAYAYMPDTRYTVTIVAESSGLMPRKFTRFLISAEPEKEDEMSDIGVFDIMDESMTKFADHCANAVVETSKVPKEEVSVAWTSPSEGSGCILIRATILETPDTWYMDDSNLVLNMCQDTKAKADDQGPVLSSCCACDEAKYEVTFQGLWSRNTHPKDFPSKGWLIRFSDVIGASHTIDYRFWEYNGMASIGLKQVAELGSTRRLESELKNQSENIRTIIKARGISYPNLAGQTFAVFRVDRKHHLMSLVSMIDPSPDWIVGVSGLELCQEDCTWIEHKELNLYPYDAGTDSGITYLSPNSPTEPQEEIRRITSTYPNDSRSPFYDPSGLDMKPLAKLYLNRQRLYEKTCHNLPNEASDTGAVKTKSRRNKACKVTPWSSWSNCSVTCGKGSKLKQRNYRNETLATLHKCNVSLTERQSCYGEDAQCGNSGQSSDTISEIRCEFTEWSEWSECSATCGRATRSRTRKFKNKEFRKLCRGKGLELEQSMNCDDVNPCPGQESDEVRDRLSEQDEENDNTEKNNDVANYQANPPEVEKCPEHLYTAWSLWSPCSSSCGLGARSRSRHNKAKWNQENLDKVHDFDECEHEEQPCNAQILSCHFTKQEAEAICSEPMDVGSCDGNNLRVFFDKRDGQCHQFRYTGCKGNRNNFPTKQDCETVCRSYQKTHAEFKGLEAGSQVAEMGNEPMNCQVTEWTNWSKCQSCHDVIYKTRQLIVPHSGGGTECPKKLIRRKRCRKLRECANCKLSSWSSWSRCEGTCGNGSQYKRRNVESRPHGPNGRLCSSVIQYRNCTLDCP